MFYLVPADKSLSYPRGIVFFYGIKFSRRERHTVILVIIIGEKKIMVYIFARDEQENKISSYSFFLIYLWSSSVTESISDGNKEKHVRTAVRRRNQQKSVRF